MKNQTQTPNPAIAQANQDCAELIEAMEKSFDRLKKRQQRIREGLESLLEWMEPKVPPPTVIEPNFRIVTGEQEGEAK